jgi:hypothetical protein
MIQDCLEVLSGRCIPLMSIPVIRSRQEWSSPENCSNSGEGYDASKESTGFLASRIHALLGQGSWAGAKL